MLQLFGQEMRDRLHTAGHIDGSAWQIVWPCSRQYRRKMLSVPCDPATCNIGSSRCSNGGRQAVPGDLLLQAVMLLTPLQLQLGGTHAVVMIARVDRCLSFTGVIPDGNSS